MMPIYSSYKPKKSILSRTTDLIPKIPGQVKRTYSRRLTVGALTTKNAAAGDGVHEVASIPNTLP